jgi:hypothetical protein
MKNKCGADKIISVYWFAVLFITAGGVVYMAAVFYGTPYDVREVESGIMINQVADCIASGGILKPEWNDLTSEAIISLCHLNFATEDTNGWNNDQYYLEINYYDFDINNGVNKDSAKNKVSSGNLQLKDFCLAVENNPLCIKKSFYVLEGSSPKLIEIKSVVRKTEKND